jgi:NADH-quinone oxidoreductase subunit C
MDHQAIYDRLVGQLGAEVVLGNTAATDGIRDPFVTVAGGKIDQLCRFCRDDEVLRLDFCQSITAVDTGEHLTCVYHLYSYTHSHTLVIKATTPRAEPHLPSCAAIWPAADWYEREAYDLLGITFDGHPDLRRLLLPDDWPGHPLRKDWKEPAFYNGIPTTRDNTLDLLEDA